jgi:hypothetical protein
VKIGIDDVIDILISQITDPFRIGLMIALVVTMIRTSAVTGKFLPLVLGVVFVAVIVPSSLPSSDVPFVDAVLYGLISNLVILLPILTVAAVISRYRR